ncbi:HAD family hydrolase [Microbacterium pseudoresistens]|uniref:Cof subfamily protein (Haloacid dehalogenase superfamily) n=1 Tax=Microbacterium pseudoresistens TaxID=640634 RepID=A0A7Y9ETM1_9MICO|nr:HAD family hydrolase [Microbacterium pseudoresistens]NYD53703.1 Cof subfamily protein (haloacid dehalogenase superfamily) [Microbacterium pseudoresistens]
MTAWLIGLDVDGTLVFEDETFSPGVVEAVARVRDAGHEVTLATGRSWVTAGRFLDELGIAPEYVVCSNGAVTMRRTADGYERWHVETFDPRAVLGLLAERLSEARYMVELADGERLYTDVIGEWALENARQVSFDELSAQEVSRVVVVSPRHDEADFQRLVREVGLDEVSYAIGWTAWLDIAPHGVDKGTALERVRAAREHDGARVFVAGDGRNDIGMFGWAQAVGGRAVAMGQAPDEVKAAATETTASVEQGGLAVALETIPAM